MSVRMERHTPDLSRMARERPQLLARAGVPQFDRPVRASGRQACIVGAEGDSGYPVLVAVERKLLTTRGNVPQFDAVIRAPGGQVLAIVAECQAQHLIGMAL